MDALFPSPDWVQATRAFFARLVFQLGNPCGILRWFRHFFGQVCERGLQSTVDKDVILRKMLEIKIRGKYW